VTKVPQEIVPQILDIAEEFIASEKIVLDYVKGPNPTAAGLGAARKEFSAVVAKLIERAKKSR
jgi:hypothetical protein